jgi:GT2 family glycosyltransferase/glycosyltransferase involved in cell wall biosynthesis
MPQRSSFPSVELRPFIGPGSVVVNIGASAATTSSELARMVGAGGRVYSFGGHFFKTADVPISSAGDEPCSAAIKDLDAERDILGREKVDLVCIDSSCLDGALEALRDQLRENRPILVLELTSLAQALRTAELLWREEYVLYAHQHPVIPPTWEHVATDGITLVGFGHSGQAPPLISKQISSPADLLFLPLPLLETEILNGASGSAAIGRALRDITSMFEASLSARENSVGEPAATNQRSLPVSGLGVMDQVEAYEALSESYSKLQKEFESVHDSLAAVSNANQIARRQLAAEAGNWRSIVSVRFRNRGNELRSQLRTLEKSRLFDRQWYRDTYPDVIASGIDPLAHYLLFGGFEGRLPNPAFDSEWYFSSNQDVRRAGINPLLHYILYGAKERRPTSPNFDTAFYLESNPDVAASHMNPLLHFLRHGRKEGRKSVKPANWRAPDIEIAPRPTAPSHSEWENLIDAKKERAAGQPDMDVIIPVYRGYDDTLACIHSVLSAKTQTSFELVVIDDCSPEHRLSEMLAELAARGLFTYLRNEENLGFVRTCNRGMSLHQDRDVLLLNSDTVVYNDWLDRMRAAASPRDVGTVTPLSTNATICSYPIPNRDNNERLEIDYPALDNLCSTVNVGESIEVPTAVGFCMYIRRDCLDDVGLFDEATFGKGYGEENDLCRRAAKRSWRNIVACNVFVRHTGEVSFSATATKTRQDAQTALQQKHPEYAGAVRDFIARDPLAPLRRRVDAARLGAAGGEQTILHVAHTWGGGVTRHINDLAEQFRESGWGSIVMAPKTRDQPLVDIMGVPPLPVTNLIGLDLASSQNEIASLLKLAKVKRIHIHSLAGWPLSATLFLPAVAAKLGVPYGFTFHDYLPFCPRINMVDHSGLYCGEPGIQSCRTCLAKNGSPFGDVDIDYWRLRYDRLLAGADRLIVPSEDASKRVRRYLPGREILVRPHAQAAAEIRTNSINWSRQMPLRVAIIGAIGPHKGSAVLAAVAKNALDRRLPIEFVVIGYTDRDSKFRNLSNVRITGSYAEEEVQKILLSEAPHLAFLPSVWPETFCYTLSIALAAGLPVAVFDLGAQRERLTELKNARSIILPIELASRPERINDMLLEAAERFASEDEPGELTLPQVRYGCASYYGLDS